jgi:hypothetical protein
MSPLGFQVLDSVAVTATVTVPDVVPGPVAVADLGHGHGGGREHGEFFLESDGLID